ncbi:uncharacterized protein LOC141601152 [Silene latifolia]|uniref:uncharacterized protein LOC141601152 n=1 Tax=Silene latifolia TaxID=37657 RepID=UPI003D78AF20
MEKGIGSLDNSDWDTYSCDMNSADEFHDDELETILSDRISEDNVEEDNPDLDLDDKDDILGEDEDPDVTNLDDITRIVLEKLKDSEMPLYKNCKNYTKLSAVVKLYNLKAKNGWSDRSFTNLLELLKDMLPEDNVVPNRTYAAKKILRGIGMKYVKIHACPNDCIFYRKEYESLLRRLFANKKDAKLLTWHNSAKQNDGKLRQPADGLEWKHIDAKYPEFGKEPINLRLAVSTDGMNPYRNLSSQHSTWHKILMLSLLISGPKEPGNDLDVYLAPLLDDLRTLWDEGVEVFDAYQNSVFNLKAMLLCTISDFPAYGNLCGHTVHGKEVCPLCGEDVDSCYLKFSKKQAFLGYRRFLDEDHFYRRFCFFFNAICNKVIDSAELDELQNLIVTSLCQFEMYFPPSFFTIMVHLTVHLVREIKYLGPVYLRYQYPFERLMKVYKDYTSNRYRPKGCIAERAIIDEALSFCYTHLSNSELLGIPKNRHSEWMMGKGLRGHVRQGMAADKWHTAHTYVLHNEDEVQPYIEEHKALLRKNH